LALSGFDADHEGRVRFHDFVLARSGAGVDEDAVEARRPAAGPRPDDAPRSTLPAPEEVLARVCRELDISRDVIAWPHRSAAAVHARRTALGVWRELGGTLATMATELRISRAAASMLLKRSDARENAARRVLAIARSLEDR